mgnify:CR=1 FL=1
MSTILTFPASGVNSWTFLSSMWRFAASITFLRGRSCGIFLIFSIFGYFSFIFWRSSLFDSNAVNFPIFTISFKDFVMFFFFYQLWRLCLLHSLIECERIILSFYDNMLLRARVPTTMRSRINSSFWVRNWHVSASLNRLSIKSITDSCAPWTRLLNWRQHLCGPRNEFRKVVLLLRYWRGLSYNWIFCVEKNF